MQHNQMWTVGFQTDPLPQFQIAFCLDGLKRDNKKTRGLRICPWLQARGSILNRGLFYWAGFGVAGFGADAAAGGVAGFGAGAAAAGAPAFMGYAWS